MYRVSSLIVSGSLVFVGLVTVRAAPALVPFVRPVVITEQLPNQEQVRAFAGTIISQNDGMFERRSNSPPKRATVPRVGERPNRLADSDDAH